MEGFMNIGFVISSITKSIPYMTYFDSLNYQVFPIMLCKNMLYSDSISKSKKLDCLIIIVHPDIITFLKKIEYEQFLEDNAPIIFCIQQDDIVIPLQDLTHCNIHVVNYKSDSIMDNCHVMASNLNKVLSKK